MNPSSLHQKKGFTLVELLVVVAIIGILAAVAVAQYERYRERGYLAHALIGMSSLITSIEVEIGDYQQQGTCDELFSDNMFDVTDPIRVRAGLVDPELCVSYYVNTGAAPSDFCITRIMAEVSHLRGPEGYSDPVFRIGVLHYYDSDPNNNQYDRRVDEVYCSLEPPLQPD